jgi:hypothetical protein
MAGYNLLRRALRHARGRDGRLQDAVNGPSHTFFVRAERGWRANEIDRLLRGHGVHVWGEIIVAGDMMFTVRRAQARWAQYLLERAGVPIKEGSAFCASTQISRPRPPATV